MYSCRDLGGPFPVCRADSGRSRTDCTGGCPFLWIRQSLVLPCILGCLRRRWFLDCSHRRVLVVREYSSGRLSEGSCHCVSALLRWGGLLRHHGGRSIDRNCFANSTGTKAPSREIGSLPVEGLPTSIRNSQDDKAECVKYFWPRHDGSSWPHPDVTCGRAPSSMAIFR